LCALSYVFKLIFVLEVLENLKVIVVWVAEELDDHLELLFLLLTREKFFPGEHLREDATYRPHINGGRVLFPRQEDLWRSVPPCCDVVGQHYRMALQEWDFCAGETEIANLQVTVRINQEIARFQVSVENARRMNIFEAP